MGQKPLLLTDSLDNCNTIAIEEHTLQEMEERLLQGPHVYYHGGASADEIDDLNSDYGRGSTG